MITTTQAKFCPNAVTNTLHGWLCFFEQILVMEDSDSFEVRFKITGRNSERMLGNYFSMVFPMRGFSAISGDLKDCMNQG